MKKPILFFVQTFFYISLLTWRYNSAGEKIFII